MEDHPIPQDITGFQFKLIGKLTVKQFGYVAAGVILAWLIYFVLKIPGIIGIPLAISFIIIGLALAFFPIDGRPLDVMLGNFIRALFTPSQYTYEKQGGGTNSTILSSQPAHPMGNQTQSLQPQVAVQTQTTTHSPNVFSAPIQPVKLGAQINPTPQTTPQSEAQVEAEEKKEEEKVEELTQEVAKAKEQNDSEQARQLQQALDESIKQKAALEKELSELKAKLELISQPPAPAAPTPLPEPLPVPPPQAPVQPLVVSRIPEPVPQPVAQPQPTPPAEAPTPTPTAPAPTPTPGTLDQEPNLITGVVRDPRGNPIQNVLVEVKDQDENPVRAFKTNGRGEFASATSLANGQYTIILEDPKMVHKFDSISILATGNPISPIEITSIDPREELRRELFN